MYFRYFNWFMNTSRTKAKYFYRKENVYKFKCLQINLKSQNILKILSNIENLHITNIS